jgi:hypothetical protein
LSAPFGGVSPADDRAILETILHEREAQSVIDWAKDRADELRASDPKRTGSNLEGLAARPDAEGGSLGALRELSSELPREAN